MKALAMPLVALVLLAVSGGAALAHPDNLGAPDPYWQRDSVSTTSADVGRGDAAASVARFWKGCVYASGVVALLLVLSIVRTLHASKPPSSRDDLSPQPRSS